MGSPKRRRFLNPVREVLDYGLGRNAQHWEYAVVSAFNPGAPEAKNLERHWQLLDELKERFPRLRVEPGNWRGQKELDIRVENMPLSQALDYGRRYGQEAVLIKPKGEQPQLVKVPRFGRGTLRP